MIQEEQDTTRDYFYSEEEILELKRRAATDHISMVALNNYMLGHSNILSELHEILMVRIKTDIVDPIKSDSFKLKQDDGCIDSLMALFDKIPRIVDGMTKLKSAKDGDYSQKKADREGSIVSKIDQNNS